MSFKPGFLRIATLTIASILLITGAAAVCSVCARPRQEQSAAEHYVLQRLQRGLPADLEEFSGSHKLNASFIAGLLTGHNLELKTHPQKISIWNAVITGELDLSGQEIPYDVFLRHCRFENGVNLRGSHFARILYISSSTFDGVVDFGTATIESDLYAVDCRFVLFAWFRELRVGHDLIIANATFDTLETSFAGARVGGVFFADNSKFSSRLVRFDRMHVDGSFSAKSCVFGFNESDAKANESSDEGPKSLVTFNGSHFADFFLNDSSFEKISTVDFTRMQADLVSFDGVELKTPSEVELQLMTFKALSPLGPDKLLFLLSHYDAEFFTALEGSLRTRGYAEAADNVFIAKKRAERRENCKSFLHQCQRGAWALSVFEDLLSGYGKSLQNLLYWSVGFLFVGTFVFRSEKGMRTKDGKHAEDYEGKYNAFWYSLDLFLPIIKLGEADVWTPKDERRWANLYRRVHIIIGSLFVPIGLAAWTGIIK